MLAIPRVERGKENGAGILELFLSSLTITSQARPETSRIGIGSGVFIVICEYSRIDE
jgi:hypothetical protein